MLRRFRVLFVVTSALAFSVVHTKADVIFDNFGPNHSFSIFSYGFGRVPTESMRAYTAAAFTVPTDQSFRLQDFTMAVQFGLVTSFLPLPQPFDIMLLDSSPSGMPDKIIESFTEMVIAPVAPSLFTINSALHPILLPGNQYWIAATVGSVTDPQISGGWALNAVGDIGPVAQGTDLGSLTPGEFARPAFEVDGTSVAAVPEPNGVLLLCTGMLVLCLVLSHHKVAR